MFAGEVSFPFYLMREPLLVDMGGRLSDAPVLDATTIVLLATAAVCLHVAVA